MNQNEARTRDTIQTRNSTHKGRNERHKTCQKAVCCKPTKAGAKHESQQARRKIDVALTGTVEGSETLTKTGPNKQGVALTLEMLQTRRKPRISRTKPNVTQVSHDPAIIFLYFLYSFDIAA